MVEGAIDFTPGNNSIEHMQMPWHGMHGIEEMGEVDFIHLRGRYSNCNITYIQCVLTIHP